jgi:hypothetical protein
LAAIGKTKKDVRILTWQITTAKSAVLKLQEDRKSPDVFSVGSILWRSKGLFFHWLAASEGLDNGDLTVYLSVYQFICRMAATQANCRIFVAFVRETCKVRAWKPKTRVNADRRQTFASCDSSSQPFISSKVRLRCLRLLCHYQNAGKR